MIVALTKRYWMTCLGGAFVAAIVVTGVLTVGATTVGRLVETSIRQKGDYFAELLTSQREDLQAFLTGISRDPDAEMRVRAIASLSDIGSFSIFDTEGTEVFASRSDRYKWLLRDRPGGITSGDRLSVETMRRTDGAQIVQDDGVTNPSAINPLILDRRVVGYVSVVAEMIDDRYAFQQTLAAASVNLLAVLFLATGLPTLLYWRRKRKMAEADERIQFLANHDALTHLLNRARMQSETDRIIAMSRATRESMAYFLLDIDGFAEINDEMGQAQGDELLRTIASRLSRCVDRSDLIGRIGSDDFVSLHRRAGGDAELARLARQMTAALVEPVQLSGGTVRPQISIGIARMPQDGRSHDELIKHAELALLHHKANKTEDFALYDASMDAEVSRRKLIEAMVRDACETGKFELFYQPIVAGADLQLVGFEALLRLPDGQGGYISPTVFVPIAESRGYIKAIGTWVIQEACRQIALWPEHLYVSVNLSAVQFRGGDLVDVVRAALAETGIAGRRLETEIVESLLLERSEAVLSQLQQLQDLGVTIAMDDFGTGYSSLGYLWRFQFDKLKIDQSFMTAFQAGEPNVSHIIETIVTMAHHMKMTVTAEGVETQAQVDLLTSLGCDYIQGYKFGRPMPAAQAAGEILSVFAASGRLGRDAGAALPHPSMSPRMVLS